MAGAGKASGSHKCPVNSCDNNTNNKDLVFYRFPADRTRAELWLDKLKNEALRDLTPKTLRNRRVCQIHFESKCFINPKFKTRGLTWDACPTLLLGGNVPSSLDQIQAPFVVQPPADTLQGNGSSYSVPSTSLVHNDHCYSAVAQAPYVGDVDLNEQEHRNIVDPADNPNESFLSNIQNRFSKLTSHVSSISLQTPCKGPDVVELAEVEATGEETGVEPGTIRPNSGKMKAKRPRNWKKMPAVPRIQKSQKSPLVLSLIKSNTILRRRHVRLRRNYLEKCRKLHIMKTKKDQVALEFCKERLPQQFYQLLCCQLRNANRKPQGYRYTSEDLALFLDWNERSPKLYRVLGMIKPGRMTLKKLLRGLKIKPGINPAIMSALTSRASSLPEEEQEVTLVFDGISLKCGLEYNARLDSIIGLVELAGGEIQFQMAEEALVFMVRSIYGTWKQAVAFYFVNGKMTGADFSNMILEVIFALQKTGLKVRITINDGLGKNRTALEILGATYHEPWFYVNAQLIFAFYDYVHCFKNMRNNLMAYLLRLLNGKIVNFAYIKYFVERDMQQPRRLAPKVTKSHIEPNSFQKQRVPLATELFSKHVAAGMSTYALLTNELPQDALVTANFVGDMNDLFDSLNGTKVKPNDPLKSVVTKGSPHIALWDKWRNEMNHWEFIGSKQIQFDKQWSMTLTAAIYFVQAALEGEGKTQVPMGHLNQDCIENFFSGIREKGGHRKNPNCAEFESSYASSIVNQLTLQKKGQNCRNDEGVSLLHLKGLLQMAKEMREQEEVVADQPNIRIEQEVEEEIVEEEGLETEADQAAGPTPGPSSTNVLQDAGICTTAAPLVMDFLKKIQCEDCRSVLLEECSFPKHFNNMMLSSSDPNSTFPSERVTNALEVILKKGPEVLPAIMTQGKGVLEKFMQCIKTLPAVQLLSLCPSHNGQEDKLLKILAHESLRQTMKWALEVLRPKRKPRSNPKAKNMQHL